MGKYTNVEDSIFDIFGSANWVAENVKTVPTNFVDANLGNEYIRVTILSNATEVSLNSANGLLHIDIFIPAGLGPRPTSLIADKLDGFLRNKSIVLDGGCLQLKQSSLSDLGICKDNPSLNRSLYSIPFNYFGVSQ